ncbi:MAG: hypothetical protein P1V35_06030 [Planctomycetota bacterium]|nr:hypothetical protein [Planctomycetota bacterium]
MSQTRHTFHWRPGDPDGDMQLRLPLSRKLEGLLDDRTSTAEEVVLEASEILCTWLGTLPDSDALQLGALLGTELDPLLAVHGWRAPVQLWMRTIDRVVGQSPRFQRPLRAVLMEELGLWLGGVDVADFQADWNGEPLAPGRRLPRRANCAQALVPGMEKHEIIAIPAFSETVALAVEHLAQSGLQPKLILGEGGPTLGGRLMARRLEHLGLDMRLIYDAGMPEKVAEADRLWMGTEAIGADSLLATIGTGNVFQAARKSQVPCTVLATSDKLVPMGDLRLPEWAEKETYLLWEAPVSGLQVESQFYERLPIQETLVFATEFGIQSPAQLAMSALRTDDLA